MPRDRRASLDASLPLSPPTFAAPVRTPRAAAALSLAPPRAALRAPLGRATLAPLGRRPPRTRLRRRPATTGGGQCRAAAGPRGRAPAERAKQGRGRGDWELGSH